MKPGIGVGAGLIEPHKLGCAMFVTCLLVPLLFLSTLRTSGQPLSIVSLQVWVSSSAGAHDQVLVVETTSSGSGNGTAATMQPGITQYQDGASINRIGEHVEGARIPRAASNTTTLLHDKFGRLQMPQVSEEKPVQDNPRRPWSPTQLLSTSVSTSSQTFSAYSSSESSSPMPSVVHPAAEKPMAAGSMEGHDARGDDRSSVECDFSGNRADVCELRGDVRIHGPSSTVKLIATPPRVQNPADQNASASATWKVRPYARKWEADTMSYIRELTLSMSPSATTEDDNSKNAHRSSLRCSLNHSVPAVVFSTGGFQGNFFHELVDVLTPLFLTSHHYGGQVQILIVDFKPWWVEKYKAIIKRLSWYEVINLDVDDRVHCFRDVVVGLRSHRELGIDPVRAPKGSSMLDFRRFLRRCFQLRRDFVLTPPNQLLETPRVAASAGRNPPRLLIVSRKKTRVLINERQVAIMARGLGYKVIISGPELARNLTQMARIVNSCDVMIGVHGAGLSNMVFLPTNATVIQIIPWGGLKYACGFAFGEPAVAMGIRYLEYEIGKRESSLIKHYPKNHPVLTDPLSIHKQGFGAIWSTFLNKQDVTLDLERFKGVLRQALESS